MSSRQKDLNKLLKRVEAQDWRVRRGNHIMCFSPNGEHIVTIAGSAKSSSLDKVINDLKRGGFKTNV